MAAQSKPEQILRKMAGARAFAKYRRADAESFDSIMRVLGDYFVKPRPHASRLWRALPRAKNLFIVIDPKTLPFDSYNEKWCDPSVFLKCALQNLAREKFGYGGKGYVRTTALGASLIYHLDFYFDEASRKSGRAAFRAFREIVLQGFDLRASLARYGDKHHSRAERPRFAAILRKLKGYRPRKRVLGGSESDGIAIAEFIQSAYFHCGTVSIAGDRKSFKRLKDALQESHTMTEFLAAIKGSGT